MISNSNVFGLPMVESTSTSTTLTITPEKLRLLLQQAGYAVPRKFSLRAKVSAKEEAREAECISIEWRTSRSKLVHGEPAPTLSTEELQGPGAGREMRITTPFEV